MAGKFLSIDEAAQRLGVNVEEVNRLVDRKKLFPMRDGTSVKFKADDVDRLAASLAEESASEDGDSIQLDLDDGGAAASGPRTGSGLGAGGSGLELADDELVLGEPDGGLDGSRTLIGGAAAAGSSPALLGGDDNESISLFDDAAAGGNDDLLLESVVSASSPALSGVDSLDLDEPPARGTVELPGAAGPAASGIAGLSNPSAIGAALGDPLESGISLEDGDLKGSGIDLDIGSDIGGGIGGSGLAIGGASGIGGGSGIGASELVGGSGIGGVSGIGGPGSLVGDQFDLGGSGLGEDDSASVVVATEMTGDSSFFGAAMGDDSASVSFDESASSSFDATGIGPDMGFDYAIDTSFNTWQIVGLICCALVLFFGGLVMFDLAWTIRSPGGTPFSAPLIGGLAQIFGWQ